MLVELFEFFGEIIDRAFLELAQTDPAKTWLHHLALDALGFDFFTDDADGEGAVLVFAVDREHDLGARLSAHAFDGFIQRQAFDGRVVNLGDQVARLHASAKSRRALDRRDDFDEAFFLGDFNTDTDKATGCAFTKLFESFFVVVLRVRIQARDHACDGVADELLFIDWLDIVALDHTKYGGKLLQLFEGQGRHIGARDGLYRHGRQYACQAAYGDPSSDFEFFAHEFFVVEHQ